VPSLSFIATANAAWHCGATPVFAGITPRTYNLDPAAAERAITPRTRAIMPVHQVGLPAEMTRFLELGTKYGVAIIEDAGCAIGAKRMTDMQAVLGLSQLEGPDGILERGRRLAESCTAAIEQLEHLEPPDDSSAHDSHVAVLLSPRATVGSTDGADAPSATGRDTHPPGGDGDPRGGVVRRRGRAAAAH
jgi:dTDP-4-amino-4,6-dideoxygalactose transaminase